MSGDKGFFGMEDGVDYSEGKGGTWEDLWRHKNEMIEKLKEELKRERECVNYLVTEEQKVMDGKSFEGESLMDCAEKARETQKQREIKL